MWPWSKIKELQAQVDNLKCDIARYKSFGLSRQDTAELDFLRRAIADYVVYDYQYSQWDATYEFFATRTLQEAESDLTRARFYISVLEAQLGPDGIVAAKKVCERLRDLCKTKAIEAKQE